MGHNGKLGLPALHTASRRRSWCASAALLSVLIACHHDSTAPVRPTALEASGAATVTGIVGAVLSPAPAFVVKDASGQTLGGIPITVTISGGGGTLRSAPTRSAANGPTSVGQWTLGTRSGRNAVTITSGSLPALTIEVSALPGPAVSLVVGAGDSQRAPAGDRLVQPISAKVLDQFGNGVPGNAVAFTVSRGGGTISGSSAVSDDDGVAGGFNWTLGRIGGDQEVVAIAQLAQGAEIVKFGATVLSDFEVVVRFFGEPPTGDIAASFTNAGSRVRALVTGDIADVPLTNFDASRCGVANETLSELVDDILIYATVTTIDGPGKILGSAGPCIIRSASRLAVIGVMRFDIDDLTNLASTGRLEPVILHEMLHIVGVGTVWRGKNLIEASGTPDPRYIGPFAAERCNAANGQAVCGLSVPIENTGADGTRESHWREATFDSELMTGFAEAAGVPMPLSLITAASLEDYGYSVNYLAADPYAVPTVSARLRTPPDDASHAPWELFELPAFEVTPGGWIRPLRFR